MPPRIRERLDADWLQTIICRCVLESNNSVEVLRLFKDEQVENPDGEVRHATEPRFPERKLLRSSLLTVCASLSASIV